MTEDPQVSRLDKIEEVIDEVVELLNQPNLPVAVNEDPTPEAGNRSKNNFEVIAASF